MFMIFFRDTATLTAFSFLYRLKCLITGFFVLFSCGLHAEDVCNGWVGETLKILDLGLPATLDLTVSNSEKNTILASGSVAVPPLVCGDGSGNAYTMTSLNWLIGTPGSTDIRTIAPGLGLRIKYVMVGGGTSHLPSTDSGFYSNATNGLNWSTLQWELIRLSSTVTPGALPLSNIARLAIGANINGAAPTLQLMTGNPMIVTASCVIAVDNAMVVLPDISSQAMLDNGHSESVALSAGIICPGNTVMANGTSLTLTTAAQDKVDPTLVRNTGTATGVAIEVLDQHGQRVNASGGVVSQDPFTQAYTSLPGVTEEFNVRMTRLPEQVVTPGSVHGTFIITLTTN
jgi:type 1 fimbria pilin